MPVSIATTTTVIVPVAFPHDYFNYYPRLSFSSQADGSSFLQMGASLEQQILCMFKVQKPIVLPDFEQYLWKTI